MTDIVQEFRETLDELERSMRQFHNEMGTRLTAVENRVMALEPQLRPGQAWEKDGRAEVYDSREEMIAGLRAMSGPMTPPPSPAEPIFQEPCCNKRAAHARIRRAYEAEPYAAMFEGLALSVIHSFPEAANVRARAATQIENALGETISMLQSHNFGHQVSDG